jgi:RNA polymerase sigma factor (sigma-70 family)
MNSEIELVRQAAGGGRKAFAELYDRYARPVFLTLVGLLRTREDAEDAFQASFLAAWRKLPTLRRLDRIRPWLFRIARNQARDAARRQLARPAGELRGEDLIHADDGVGADEELESMVAGLTPTTRALVLLLAVHGYTAEEAALATGQSASTVRRRYARAIRHLRNQRGENDE